MTPIRLPEPIEFARRGESREAVLPVAQLVRLADHLASQDGQVGFRLRGVEEDGKHWLLLDVEARLLLRCQRCLEPMIQVLQPRARLLLVPPGRELPDETLEADDFDPIWAERDFDLLALVEDEVLLALPIAPRHASCTEPGKGDRTQTPGPFAVLATLKRSRD